MASRTLLTGAGNGPVDAFVHALREGAGFDVHVLNYHEHGVGGGEDATAVAYVQLRVGSPTRSTAWASIRTSSPRRCARCSRR